MNILLFANVGTDLSGYYHVGDEAMFIAMRQFYRRYWPKVKLSAFVSLPFQPTTQVHQQRGLPWPDTVDKARMYFLKVVLKTFLYTNCKLSFLTPDQKEFVAYIAKQDIIHCTGGGNITSECKHWMYYALVVIAVSKLLKKPVVMTSQTIGPFSSWIDKLIAITVLNTTKLITVRVYSKEQERELKRWGIRKPLVLRSLDAAYFLRSTYIPLPKKSVVRIGVSLHSRGENVDLLTRTIVDTISHLATTYKRIEILLLPHILNRSGQWDTKLMSEILETLPKGVSVISPDYYKLSNTHNDISHVIKGYTATCTAVIATRYHSVVFAISQNIPCISIVDGEYQMKKNNEALKFVFHKRAADFTCDLNVFSATSKLYMKVEKIIKQRKRITTTMRVRNISLQNKQEKYIGNLKKEINKLMIECDV